MKPRLVAVALSLAFSFRLCGVICTSGTQGANGYPDITAVCNTPFSSSVTTPPAGNEGSWYDHYYLTATGETNMKPILIFVHGGGGMVTQATEAYPTYAVLMSQFARDGFDVYHPTYTVDSFFQLQARVNPSDTTASVSWSNYTQTGGTPKGFCSNTTGWTLQVDSDIWTISAITGNLCDGAAHTITISRSSPPSTHTNGTYAFTTGLNWVTIENDMAGFLAFLANCSTGGTSPLSGACTSYTHVPGDPNQIRYWGISFGGQLGTLLILKGSCWSGALCTLINNNAGTPGYHEWPPAPWTIQNRQWTVAMVGASVASNTGEVYAQNQIQGGASATNTTSVASIMLTGGTANPGIPSCPGGSGGFNSTTLVCSSPTAVYTASLLTSPLAIINAGTAFGPGGPFMLEQSGTLDTDFNVYEPLLGARPGFLAHSLVGQSHGLDYLTGGTTGIAMTEARAVLGVNRCAQLSSGSMCPAPSQINGGGIF